VDSPSKGRGGGGEVATRFLGGKLVIIVEEGDCLLLRVVDTTSFNDDARAVVDLFS
jgi:hypothetical protein